MNFEDRKTDLPADMNEVSPADISVEQSGTATYHDARLGRMHIKMSDDLEVLEKLKSYVCVFENQIDAQEKAIKNYISWINDTFGINS